MFLINLVLAVTLNGVVVQQNSSTVHKNLHCVHKTTKCVHRYKGSVHHTVKQPVFVKLIPKIDDCPAWIGIQYDHDTGQILWIYENSSLNKYDINLGDFLVRTPNLIPAPTQNKHVGDKVILTILKQNGQLVKVEVTYIAYGN